MSNYTPTGNLSTKTQFDSEFEAIKVAIDSQLDRNPSNGQSNAMQVDFDMNGYRVLNVPAPVYSTDLVRAIDLNSVSDSASVNVGSLGLVSGIAGEEGQAIFSIAERALFVVQADGYVALDGDITLSNGLVAALQPSEDSEWSVLWFGAVADPTDTVVQDTFFEAAAQRVQDTGTVVVPSGRFKLDTATTVATQWKLAPEAEIIGLGGVSPTFSTDTARLTGSMIRLQRSEKGTQVYVGETDYALQKGREKGVVGSVVGVSPIGNGGVFGGSVTSKSNVENQACIGVSAVVYNDNTTVDRTAWGVYSEAHKTATAGGNTFSQEIAIVNKAAVVQITPNESPLYGDGITAGIWVSSGISEVSDVTASLWGAAVNAGAAFNKGLVFFNGALSVGVEYAEAISMPHNHALVWYPASGDVSETTPMSWIKALDLGSGLGEIIVHTEDVNGAGDTDYFFQTDELSVTDNVAKLGSASNRWTEVFSVNGTVNTSDLTQKEQIEALSATEQTVALACKALIKKFKWKDAVLEKGVDARIHTGVIAQEIQQAFADEGLDASDYGLFTFDVDEDGNETYGVRYTELLCFIIGAM